MIKVEILQCVFWKILSVSITFTLFFQLVAAETCRPRHRATLSVVSYLLLSLGLLVAALASSVCDVRGADSMIANWFGTFFSPFLLNIFLEIA